MKTPFRLMTIVTAVGLIVGVAGPAAAQVTPGGFQDPARERFGVGGLFGIGFPGSLTALRASVPIFPSTGVDIDLGRMNGRGLALGAQLRWEYMDRSVNGTSRYFAFGVERLNSTQSRSEVYPYVITTVPARPVFMKKATFGANAISRGGTRGGVELTIASAPNDLVLLINLFVVIGVGRH